MSPKTEIKTSHAKIATLAIIILAISYFGFYQPAQNPQPGQIAEASFEERKSIKDEELKKVESEKAKLELEAKKINLEKEVLAVEESLKATGLAQTRKK
jgi:type II secretory pathway component PulM